MAGLTHVSSSQVKNYLACNRLWYYTSILRQRPPQTEAQSRGTTVHGALEAHLKAGSIEPEILERAKSLGITEKDLTDYVASMTPFVGKPGEGLTEYKDEIPTYPGGPKYVLVVDHAREIQCGDEIIPQIDDLKTTSDFRYCKTPDELSKDVQMISYAMWALLRLYAEKNIPEPSFVSLRHVYVRTRGKRVATARDVLVTPEDVRARWDEILVTVREMDSLATHVAVTTALTQDQLAQHASTAVALGGGIDPQDIPATTTDHCSAYGGCFFRSKCFGEVYNADRPFIGLFHKEPKEIVMADSNVIPGTFPAAAAGGGPRMSLADRVKARNASGAAPAAQTAPPVASVPIGALQVATTPVTVTTTAPVAVTSSVCGAINPFLPGCDCTLMKHTGDHESTGPTGGKVSWSPDNSNMKLGASTDWKPIEPTVAAPTTASIVAAAATAAAVSPTVAQVLPPDAAPRTSTPEEVAAESAPKRGRKPKAAAEVAPAATTASPEAAAPVPAQMPTNAIAAVAAVCKLEELYIDSWPTKGAGSIPGIGEDILIGLAADAAKAAGMPDWRLVEYGKGKGAMAVLLRERLSIVPQILVVSSSTPGSDVLIEVLSPYAKRIVRALRG